MSKPILVVNRQTANDGTVVVQATIEEAGDDVTPPEVDPGDRYLANTEEGQKIRYVLKSSTPLFKIGVERRGLSIFFEQGKEVSIKPGDVLIMSGAGTFHRIEIPSLSHGSYSFFKGLSVLLSPDDDWSTEDLIRAAVVREGEPKISGENKDLLQKFGQYIELTALNSSLKQKDLNDRLASGSELELRRIEKLFADNAPDWETTDDETRKAMIDDFVDFHMDEELKNGAILPLDQSFKVYAKAHGIASTAPLEIQNLVKIIKDRRRGHVDFLMADTGEARENAKKRMVSNEGVVAHALDELAKIVPTLEDSEDRLSIANSLLKEMYAVRDFATGDLPISQRVVKTLAAIIPSLDPEYRTLFAQDFVELATFFKSSKEDLDDPKKHHDPSAQCFLETVHALEKVLPSLNPEDRPALNTELLKLTIGVEHLLPELQRATLNKSQFQAEADAAKSLAKENVLPSIAGNRGLDGFLNDIGLNRRDFDQAKGTGYEYGLIWYHLKSVEDSGTHTVLLDTLASADQLIKDHPDIFSTAKKQHAFRMGIVQSYVSSLSGNPDDIHGLGSVGRFMDHYLRTDSVKSAKRDALIEEARKMDEAFRKNSEDRDREKVEVRK